MLAQAGKDGSTLDALIEETPPILRF